MVNISENAEDAYKKGSLFLNGKWFIGDYIKSLENTIQSFLLCQQLAFEPVSCRKFQEKSLLFNHGEDQIPIVVNNGCGSLTIGYASYFTKGSESWLQHISYTDFKIIMDWLLRKYVSMLPNPAFRKLPFETFL